MAPTIEEGDTVEVPILSSPFYRPKRWDIVAISNPNAFNLLIFRIIGMPDEHIKLTSSGLYINGKKLALPEKLKEANIKYLPAFSVLSNTNKDVFQEFTTGKNEYVLLGDNTMEANDSRFDLGLVKRTSILNKAKLIKY